MAESSVYGALFFRQLGVPAEILFRPASGSPKDPEWRESAGRGACVSRRKDLTESGDSDPEVRRGIPAGEFLSVFFSPKEEGGADFP